MTQLQQSVDHMYEGVGLLSLASEAATRMGGVRITACDSGVVRSMMSLTLEQTALLARCHALPQKGLQTVMNKFREVGGVGQVVGGQATGRAAGGGWDEKMLCCLHCTDTYRSRSSGKAGHPGEEECGACEGCLLLGATQVGLNAFHGDIQVM